MLVMQATQHPEDRAAGPLQRKDAEPSGFLSLNIFFKWSEGARLCQTNCRSIEVTVLYPASPLISPSSPSSNFAVEDFEGLTESSSAETETLEHPAAMSTVDQERPEISPITKMLSRDEDLLSPTNSKPEESFFSLMSLPLELRLKIYGYLLPPRHHTVVTQLPHNGYFYNTSSVPAHSAQSFYPFGTKAPHNLTTYKVLNTNFRASFPEPSIYPAILSVSRQIKAEAEPVLYGSSEAVWDFGVHLEALKAFWGDRSENARKLARNVRVAREIPCLENREGVVSKEVDPRWVSLCEFLKTELTGLRTLDLTVWSSSGSISSFPVSSSTSVATDGVESGDWDVDEEVEKMVKEEELKRWREWEWTHDLLQMEALRQARIIWWGFQSIRGQNGESSFDSWLAGRMVGDKLVRDRMVREGVVVEGVVVLNGLES